MIKLKWNGMAILSIQLCANVWRHALDNRTHSHTGYNLFLDGAVDGAGAKFSVAISEKQQQGGGFRVGDEIKGSAWTKKYPECEYADYYRAGALKRISEPGMAEHAGGPPWIMPPDLHIYNWGRTTVRTPPVNLLFISYH